LLLKDVQELHADNAATKARLSQLERRNDELQAALAELLQNSKRLAAR
jgi:hypothetical protein